MFIDLVILSVCIIVFAVDMFRAYRDWTKTPDIVRKWVFYVTPLAIAVWFASHQLVCGWY